MYLGYCERVASYWDRWSKETWGLKAAPLLADNNKITPNSQLGFSDFAGNRLNFSKLRIRREWHCLPPMAVTPAGGEIPPSPDVVKEETQITLTKGFHKDLSSLPSESIELSSPDSGFFILRLN